MTISLEPTTIILVDGEPTTITLTAGPVTSGDYVAKSGDTMTGPLLVEHALAASPTILVGVGPVGGPPAAYLATTEPAPGIVLGAVGLPSQDGAGTPVDTALIMVPPAFTGVADGRPRFSVVDIATFSAMTIHVPDPTEPGDTVPKGYFDIVIAAKQAEIDALTTEVGVAEARITTLEAKPERVLAIYGVDFSDVIAGVLTVGYTALSWSSLSALSSGDTVLDFANPGAGRFAIFNLVLTQNAAADATVSGFGFEGLGLTINALHSTTWNVQVHGTASGPPDVIFYRLIIDQI